VDVAAGAAYVGDDGPGAVESLVGVRLSVEEAVAALLHGAVPPNLAIERDGGADGSLPGALRITDGDRFLLLLRIRVERGREGARALGTGVPPDGLTVRPIESLAIERAERR
jgi:hypothetical protein